MLIKCPHCGARPSEEFTYLGDATPIRPDSTDPAQIDRWYDYVYMRDNPKGRMHEYWHHGGGCRSWLVLERDTATHEISGSITAREWAERRKESV